MLASFSCHVYAETQGRKLRPVAAFILLRLVAGNMDVNTLASKRSELISNTAIVRIRRVIYKKIDLCVLASFSCRVYAETQGRKVRPVAGLTPPASF